MTVSLSLILAALTLLHLMLGYGLTKLFCPKEYRTLGATLFCVLTSPTLIYLEVFKVLKVCLMSEEWVEEACKKEEAEYKLQLKAYKEESEDADKD